MSIQSTINQGLTLVSLLASQSPELRAMSEHRREAAKFEKRQETYNQALASAAERREKAEANIPEGRHTPTVEEEAEARTLDELDEALEVAGENLAKERFEFDPTVENYDAIVDFRRDVHRRNVIRERGEAMRLRNEQSQATLEEALKTENERIANSRNIARLITEDIPGLDFDWQSYVPPRKENK